MSEIDREIDFPAAIDPDIVYEIESLAYDIAQVARRLNDLTQDEGVGSDAGYELDNAASTLESVVWDLENAASQGRDYFEEYEDAVQAEYDNEDDD